MSARPIPTFTAAILVVQEIAAKAGCKEKVVGDYAWSRYRTPRSEQNAYRLSSCTREGKIFYTAKGKPFKTTLAENGYQSLPGGTFWMKK